jgi:Fe-S-cluster containining protein
MLIRPVARRDLRIDSRDLPEGPAWLVRVPGETTRFWFGPAEIRVLRALDGHQPLDLVAARLGPDLDGGEAAVRALVAGFAAAGLLEEAAATRVPLAQRAAAADADGTYWGQLRPLPLHQVLDRLVDIPAAHTECASCELTCCTYSVNVTRAEADRIVAATTDDGRWRPAIFDSSERTPTGRTFTIARQADGDPIPGACTLLETDGRCQVQRLGGRPAKPIVCRLFPMRPMLTPTGPRTSMRPGCPHATSDVSAEAMATLRALLVEAAEGGAGLVVPCAPSVVEVATGLSAPWADYLRLEARALGLLDGTEDVSAALWQVTAELAASLPTPPSPLGPEPLERLTATLAPLLGEYRGPAFAEALRRVGEGGVGPSAPRAASGPVVHALEGAYPLQFATYLAGLGALRLIVAATDRHPQAASRPRETLSAYFRGFRAPQVHVAVASLPVQTLESLAVTPLT